MAAPSAPPAVPLVVAMSPIYTNTSGKTQIVDVIVPNVNTANPVTVTLNWLDASAGNFAAPLLVADVAAKDALVTARKVLDAGDAIQGSATVAGYATASVNVFIEE